MSTKKSLRSWTNVDTAFVGSVLLVLSLTSWGLTGSFESIEVSNLPPIGTIIFKQKVAERRSPERAVWGQIQSKSPVFNRDTIRTGVGASAVVTLQDSTEIVINEQTMVRLESQPKSLGLSLETGSIAAKRKKGTGGDSLSLVSDGVGVTMDDGSVSLARKTGKLEIHATQEVRVSAGGNTLLLGPDQSALLEGQKPVVSTLPVTLLSPSDLTYLISAGPLQSVGLKWRFTAKDRLVTLQVSANEDFSPILLSVSTKQSSFSLDLPDGTYRWRLVDDSGAVSPARQFHVLSRPLPLPIEPLGLQQVADPESGLVSFSWGKTPDANYRLEVFSSNDPSQPVRSITTTMTTLSLSGLPVGTYRWQVAALFPFAEAELLGPTQSFEIQKLTQIEAPRFTWVSGKEEGAPQKFSLLESGSSVLRWEPLDYAQAYEVEIAKDPGFQQVISVNKTVSNTLKCPTGFEEGDYYWRVRTIVREGSSEPSQSQTFTLVASLPLTGRGPTGIVAPSEPLNMSWTDPNRGHSYLVEVSPQLSFTDIVSSQPVNTTGSTSSRSATNSFSRPGRFYWRVVLLDEAGKPVATSTPVEFVRGGGLPSPLLLAPKGPLTWDGKSSHKITLQWSPVKDASLYRLQVFRKTGESREAVWEGESTGASVFFDEGKPNIGLYEWTVYAVQQDHGTVVQTSVPAMGTWEVVAPKALPAPIARIPKIIYINAEKK